MCITASLKLVYMSHGIQYAEESLRTALLSHTVIDFQLGTILGVIFVNTLLRNGAVSISDDNVESRETNVCNSNSGYEEYKEQV